MDLAHSQQHQAEPILEAVQPCQSEVQPYRLEDPLEHPALVEEGQQEVQQYHSVDLHLALQDPAAQGQAEAVPVEERSRSFVLRAGRPGAVGRTGL